ncbi:hypothetical protein ABLB96_11085 [Acinetobacter sp. XH1741]|uniref:hypothetical protein n=1 Tax=unclassified Acinetobacter TaxID=196816 RepID=UPI0032B60E7E
MTNQVTVYTELLNQINLPPEVTSFLINLFVVLTLLTMTTTALEKLGILKFFSKFFIKPDTTEHELKALDEITKFEKFNSSSFTNQPYAEAAYHNKEIALLNNYYKSKVKDRLALRYMFTRADNKRAFRLYSDTKTSIFLKQFGEVYVLRWWVSKWWVYPVAAVWLIFYLYVAISLLLSFLYSPAFQNSQLIGVFYYFLIVALSLGVGWLTSPLIWPLQAKIFAELKKYNPPQSI